MPPNQSFKPTPSARLNSRCYAHLEDFVLRKIVSLGASLILLASCASIPEHLDVTNSAQLSFATSASAGGLPGRFTSLDGKRIEGNPISIRVPVGRHTIEYNCPDTITMDTYPTVSATFVAGRSYVLRCEANEPGVVTER